VATATAQASYVLPGDGVYLTNGTRLVCVIGSWRDSRNRMLGVETEDAFTYETIRLRRKDLSGWREVTPDG